MRRGFLVAGLVLIVLALLIFIVGAYGIGKSFRPITANVTLNPGESIRIGAATPGSTLVLYYIDSLGKPLEAYINVNGVNLTATANGLVSISTNETGLVASLRRSGYYIVVFAPSNTTGSIYLMNNYSTPITVNYGVVSLNTYSAILTGLLVILSILLGIVGLVLVVLGVVMGHR